MRKAFSLPEAILALAVAALAAAAMYLAVDVSTNSSSDSVKRVIAEGIADQVMQEILSKRFCGPGSDPLSTTLGPTLAEVLGGRKTYDDTDDYNLYLTNPIYDRFNQRLGTGNGAGGLRPGPFALSNSYFNKWRMTVFTYFMSPSDLRVKLSSGSSYYRTIEVNVYYQLSATQYMPLAQRKQVICYVPPGT